MPRLSSSSLILLLVVSSACGGGQADSGGSLGAGESDDSAVSVQVINHDFNDVVVYLNASGRRHRLGTATGKKTSSFSIPWRRLEGDRDVHLLADPISSEQALTSDSLQVTPGQSVVWTLQPQLVGSSISVF